MTFTIDTGPRAGGYAIGKHDVLRDSARDALPETATQQEIDAETARNIVRDLLTPKKAETSRAHLCSLWPLIAEMAGRSPESFDHIILEFAEHIAAFR